MDRRRIDPFNSDVGFLDERPVQTENDDMSDAVPVSFDGSSAAPQLPHHASGPKATFTEAEINEIADEFEALEDYPVKDIPPEQLRLLSPVLRARLKKKPGIGTVLDAALSCSLGGSPRAPRGEDRLYLAMQEAHKRGISLADLPNARALITGLAIDEQKFLPGVEGHCIACKGEGCYTCEQTGLRGARPAQSESPKLTNSERQKLLEKRAEIDRLLDEG